MPSNYQAITEHNEDQLGKDTASRKTQVSMYSDPTHFVYEILQNADDYDATEVLFKLSKDNIVIEHNGVPFEEENVKAITYFGKSTSREDLVKTGRFGIGFKSVFAFTATPIIISKAEHFQIYGLYRVKGYPYPEGFPRSRTRIILPFNHESKQPNFVEKLMSKKEAYQHISKCLTKLDMNTLLFTRNIKEIRWKIGAQDDRCYSREDEIDDNERLTTIKDKDGKNEKTYLVFSKIPVWKNEEHKAVEIAFAVDKQHQLLPIDNNFLHALFPTRENTGLRFMLNGPYRTNPPRETISETDAFNLHLMKVTCRLMKELLPKLRDRKYLTVQFLSILPNEGDTLLDFYIPLRNTIINEFQNKRLTPTREKNKHATASRLYRDENEGELSALIKDKDLAILLKKKRSQPLWVANLPPRKRNERGQFVQDANAHRRNERIDDFLTMLNISKWSIYDFIEILENQPNLATKWLKKKSNTDHQELYDFLSDKADLCSDLRIVRCSDGKYRIGEECHFPIDDVEYEHQEGDTQEEHFHYVAKEVYLSGRSKNQQKKAREFLEDVGVCEVDEAERIKLILKQRYTQNAVARLEGKQHIEDMERFIAFVEDDPDKADMFEDSCIFKTSNGYLKASEIFLGAPYFNTGLAAYYDVGNVEFSFRFPLAYGGFPIDMERLGKFAEAVGAMTKLEAILDQNMHHFEGHPEWEHLGQGSGNWTEHGVDQDYTILEFHVLLDNPSIAKSKLIWQTMCSLPERELKAQFRWHARDYTRTANSSLVHELRNSKWVPQKDANSKISFVRPCNALIKCLPKGFTYETGQKWLDAVEFGKEVEQKRLENNLKRAEQRERNQRAKEMGFDSANEANTMAEIANTLKEQGKSLDELHNKLTAGKRRKERILIELEDAPEKEYEQRLRSVRSTTGTIDRRTHLRARYTTDDNNMECQMCRQDMPFKKRHSNKDYFEAVEALKKDHFPKEHEAQHLALCPNCAAKYKEVVKRDTKTREALYKLLKDSNESEIRLKSNGQTIRIWFEEKHWYDLKAVLHYYENPQDSEESTE